LYAEDAAGEFTLQIQFMLLVFFVLAITIYVIQHTQTIDMKNYVDGQVEKYGGFTTEAVNNINDYSEKHYAGRYEVTSLSGNSKKPFGESIQYEIKGTIKIFFFNLPDQLVKSRGETVSYAR
jgi:hypothetical protein